MPLSVTTAEDLDQLALELCSFISGPRRDPFIEELIVVPSAGMQRWVEQRIAENLGVAANLRFVLPGQLTADLRARSQNDDADRWRLDHITGSVFAELASIDPADETASAATMQKLRGTGSFMHRARYIADLFDRYGMHRPAMLRRWARGEFVDGRGQPLADEHLWQPELWRLVRDRCGTSPAEGLLDFLAGLAAGDAVPTPAEAIHVFGLSAPSVEFLQVLRSLSVSTTVRLLIPVTSDRVLGAAFGYSPAVAGHPLTETWGRLEQGGLTLVREYLIAEGPDGLDRPDLEPPARTTIESTPQTLLEHLQSDIRQGTSPTASAPHDDSIQFLACSGHARQVEVLRDALLRLLRDDPSLTESDIVVLCPQLTRFGPLIEAVWGPPAGHDQATADDGVPALRYRTHASRSLSPAPLVEALQALLTLMKGTATHSEIANFLALGPVRTRFGFDDDEDLSTALNWLRITNLRWGLSGDHRARHADLPADFQAHTLGQTAGALVGSMAQPDGSILPGGMASVRLDLSQFDLAARVSEFTATLDAIERAWSADSDTATAWQERLRAAANALFEVPPTEPWQHRLLDGALDHLSLIAPDDVPMSLDDVVAGIADAAGAGNRAWRSFGSGAIIIDQPQALRSIPHRVICLLGLDDDALPSPSLTTDDLMAAAPAPGDRDPRLDAKQQLLEAVLAARDHLIVTFTSRNVHTNAEIPPSVTLAELLDAAAATAGVASDSLITRRSRHAHASENFAAEDPVSFDAVALKVAEARQRRPLHRVELPESLPAEHLDTVSVDQLIRAVTNPLSVLIRDRLGAVLHRPAELPADVLPVQVNPLDRWALGDSLLRSRIRDDDPSLWHEHARASGALAPGMLGDELAAKTMNDVDAILAETASALGTTTDAVASIIDAQPRAIDLSAGDVRISGQVPVGPLGVIELSWARRKGSDELRLWLETLLVTEAGGPSRGQWFSQSNSKFEHWWCEVHDDDEHRHARTAALAYVVDLHARARRQVVPLFRETSKQLHLGDDEQARSAWSSDRPGGGDRGRVETAVFFADTPFDDLVAAPINARAEAEAIWSHVHATAEVSR